MTKTAGCHSEQSGESNGNNYLCVKKKKMKPIGCHNYFVYILTNYNKTVLYVGVTNDLERRLFEHKSDSESEKLTFAGKYNCINLIFYELYSIIDYAIEREKQIKGWDRKKKEKLISEFNPEWKFLNDEIKEI